MGSSRRTQQRIRRVALQLFAEQGYDRTRVADIARAAGVSEMTVYRHFPAKDRIVLDDPYDPSIAAAVAAQPLELPALERVRRGVAAAWECLPAEDASELRTRLRIGAAHTGLRGRMREGIVRTEDLIVAALIDQGTPRFEAVVATGAVLGALTAVLLDWATSAECGSLPEVMVSALSLLALDPTR